MKALKNILFFAILALLFLPLVQQVSGLVEEKPLSGAYNLPDTVPLSSANWFSGEFQNKYSPYYEYQIGFRPSFVRLRNQLYYWAYKASTNYIVVGKENQLFAWNYWAPFWGLDLQADTMVEKNLSDLTLLKQKLDSMGVPLLVVIGANKARINAEYLPDDYEKEERLPNNYRNYLKALKGSGIPYVDFNAVFNTIKPEFGTELFPNTGTHWSAYGMALCLDSILSFTDLHSKDTIARAIVTDVIQRDSIVDSDIDLSNDLNLIFPIDRQPNLFAKTKTTKGRKAKLFVIGDSFYWNLYQLDDFYKTVDSSSHYWYYNNTDIAFDGERHPVEEYDAVTIAQESDAVIILATEANLHLFPFEFPEEFLTKLKTR